MLNFIGEKMYFANIKREKSVSIDKISERGLSE